MFIISSVFLNAKLFERVDFPNVKFSREDLPDDADGASVEVEVQVVAEVEEGDVQEDAAALLVQGNRLQLLQRAGAQGVDDGGRAGPRAIPSRLARRVEAGVVHVEEAALFVAVEVDAEAHDASQAEQKQQPC